MQLKLLLSGFRIKHSNLFEKYLCLKLMAFAGVLKEDTKYQYECNKFAFHSGLGPSHVKGEGTHGNVDRRIQDLSQKGFREG